MRRMRISSAPAFVSNRQPGAVFTIGMGMVQPSPPTAMRALASPSSQKAVLEAVQRLRTRAEKSGNLKSTEQQKVIVEQEAQQTVIKIEPSNPQTIYVPAYNPAVVYGAWAYPSYPPYYWPPSPVWYPGAALMTGFAWGVGSLMGFHSLQGALPGGRSLAARTGAYLIYPK